jgi:hypothetical protein
MVRLLENLCEERYGKSWTKELPENLYVLPEMLDVLQDQNARSKKRQTKFK